MSTSGEDPKQLKGIVVNGRSGISVTLPKDWYAIYYSEGMLGIFSEKSDGLFTFSVFPLELYKNSDPDSTKDYKEEEEEKDVDGIFTRYLEEHEDKTHDYMVWETETKKHRVTFTYQGPDGDLYKDMPTVRKIIHSIKFPAEDGHNLLTK